LFLKGAKKRDGRLGFAACKAVESWL